MKTGAATLALLLTAAPSASAFTPSAFTRQTKTVSSRTSSTRIAAVDPSFFGDLSSLLVSDGGLLDAASTVGTDVAQTVVTTGAADSAATAVGAAASASPEVMEAAADASNNGWFGFLTLPIEGLLNIIHNTLVSTGMDANAWGVSIIVMTLVIKAATFPLTKSQLESTNKMQALQPVIKEAQAKYQSNPEVMNQKIAEIYQTNNVNPLAGCVPSLVQIPVFIGLYRAVLNLAKENALDESFLWLPNLEGPTYGADPASGSDWIFKNWVDGVPSLGWDDTLAFLAIPLILVVSQYASMQIMQPKSQDPQQQQANAILKFLPFMIGYFSLNVPAALGIYWVTNNFVTTAITLLVRQSMKNEPIMAAAPSASAGPSVIDAEQTVFTPAPMREKPAGFGAETEVEVGGVKPITPMDAEVVAEETAPPAGASIPAAPKSKKRGKKKKKRRN